MKTTATKKFGQALLTIGASCAVFIAANALGAAPVAQAAPERDYFFDFNADYGAGYGWYRDWNPQRNFERDAGNRFVHPDADTDTGSANETKAGGKTEAGSATANAIIAKGKQYMGVPYKFGAKTGSTASFDCSSFTQYLYREHGISIPRESIEQSRAGTYVPRSELQPGDLVFFYSPVHHVAIYIGGGKILHTYGDPGVTITELDTGWWDKHYTTARRVIQ